MNTPVPSSPDTTLSPLWRMGRRVLLAVAALATLIAVLYTVETWRGKRAWDNCRRALVAKGEVIDWTACIPAPVPDDQNFFKAPKMDEWFVKNNSRPARNTNAPAPFALPPRKETNLVVAEVTVVTRNPSPELQPAGTVLRLDDPAARDQVAKLISQAIGPSAIGAKQCVLLAQPLSGIKPLHLVLQADTAPPIRELAAFFPGSPLTNLALAYSAINYLQIDAAGSNAFRVSLKAPVYDAAGYLAWTEPLTANFDLVRKALERPYARIDCDYQQPYAIGIPAFLTIREAVQILSQRAQSYLLLGQPEKAWRELALTHDMCRMMLAQPSGKPMTLVAAMINVAVAGLHVAIVEDGLRLHAWHEPQLSTIERQLRDTNLLLPVIESFREERAATSRTFETTSRHELVKLFSIDDLSTKLALRWMPRGWFYQNMAVGAGLDQGVIDSMDPTNQLVRSSQLTQMVQRMSPERRSPYRFLLALSLPNFAKAVQTTACNQTQVNQARFGCALERYRLAQGHYPETLEALTPRFLEQPPHDLMGGQPLHYRRSETGGYLLYSVGWDEKDHGGVRGKSKEQGDWVWEIQ